MIGEILELRTLLRAPQLSGSELECVRERKLRAVICHAYDNVPYYRSLFQSAGLTPADIRTAEDLRHIPLTTKEDLRQAGYRQTTASTIDVRSCLAVHTSGTTGKPLVVYLSPQELRTRRLIDFRALLSVGFRPRDVLAILGPERARPMRLHERVGLFRTEVVPGFLSVDEQVKRIRQIQPTVLWAYPSVLRTVLQRVHYRLEDLCVPRMLITSAERLDHVMSARLGTGAITERFNFYGANEVGRIAFECPAYEGLHVNADHVILECLENGQAIDGRATGRVVLTTLNVFTMPFIRYQLEDISAPVRHRCSCGSSFPLIAPPNGRESDVIRLPSGALLSPWALEFVLRSLEGIDQFRVIQESSDHLVVQLVSSNGFSASALAELQSRLLNRVGEPVKLDINLVGAIRNDALKFKSFISKLPRIDA
jgi:phenylacetate-CoA ligase